LLPVAAAVLLFPLPACGPSTPENPTPRPARSASGEESPQSGSASDTVRAEATSASIDPDRAEREEDYERLAMMLIEFGDAWAARDTETASAMVAEDYGVDNPDSVPLPSILDMLQAPEGWDIWIDVMNARIDISSDRATAYPIRAGDPSFTLPPVRMDFVKRDGDWKIAAFVPDSVDTKSAEEIRGELETPELQY